MCVCVRVHVHALCVSSFRAFVNHILGLPKNKQINKKKSKWQTGSIIHHLMLYTIKFWNAKKTNDKISLFLYPTGGKKVADRGREEVGESLSR